MIIRQQIAPVLSLRSHTELLQFSLDRRESLGSSRVENQLSLDELVQILQGLGLTIVGYIIFP